jgi:hypothetical protein
MNREEMVKNVWILISLSSDSCTFLSKTLNNEICPVLSFDFPVQ